MSIVPSMRHRVLHVFGHEDNFVDLDPLLAHAGLDHRYAEETLTADPAAWKDRQGTRSSRWGLLTCDGTGNGRIDNIGQPEAGYYWLLESVSVEPMGAGGTFLTAGLLDIYTGSHDNSPGKIAGMPTITAVNGGFLQCDPPAYIMEQSPVIAQAFAVAPVSLILAVRIQIRVIALT